MSKRTDYWQTWKAQIVNRFMPVTRWLRKWGELACNFALLLVVSATLGAVRQQTQTAHDAMALTERLAEADKALAKELAEADKALTERLAEESKDQSLQLARDAEKPFPTISAISYDKRLGVMVIHVENPFDAPVFDTSLTFTIAETNWPELHALIPTQSLIAPRQTQYFRLPYIESVTNKAAQCIGAFQNGQAEFVFGLSYSDRYGDRHSARQRIEHRLMKGEGIDLDRISYAHTIQYRILPTPKGTVYEPPTIHATSTVHPQR